LKNLEIGFKSFDLNSNIFSKTCLETNLINGILMILFWQMFGKCSFLGKTPSESNEQKDFDRFAFI
jgi:hypothetical protein